MSPTLSTPPSKRRCGSRPSPALRYRSRATTRPRASGQHRPYATWRLSRRYPPGGRSRSNRRDARGGCQPWEGANTSGSHFGSHMPANQDPQHSELVGMAGFEPAASCSQSRRANQAAPHPAEPTVAYRSSQFRGRHRHRAAWQQTGAAGHVRHGRPALRPRDGAAHARSRYATRDDLAGAAGSVAPSWVTRA
jgi:hypothetical protein